LRFGSEGARWPGGVTVRASIGRDAEGLRAASRASGVHIVAGCGYFIDVLIPDDVKEQSVEWMTEEMLRELTQGIDDTGVRAGIIGEIGVSEALQPVEEKALRAAARAHAETGVTISVHLPATRIAHDVVDLLEEEGVPPRRIVLGHLDKLLSFSDPDGIQLELTAPLEK